MKMTFFILLLMTTFASDEYENSAENDTTSVKKEQGAETLIFVKIEEDEYVKKKPASQYIGVFYNKRIAKWRAYRRSKKENKTISNGSYNNEETAAHASDTLAKKLMNNGEIGHELNFPDDGTEVWLDEKKLTSKYIGVSYNTRILRWVVQRWSKKEKAQIHDGCFKNEGKAAHASDTLARKLMKNGEQGHKLNFPDDDIEVHRKKFLSQYIGVSINKNRSKWRARRRSKHEKKLILNGNYESEETAAHASDTLARKLMKNGDQNLKLNFPDNDDEVWPEQYQQKKRKRSEDLESSQETLSDLNVA